MADYDPGNIFAKILRGEAPCSTVYDDDVALAFMDIMPRTAGHVLVIPKTPARNLLDVPADAIGPYMQRVQTVSRAAMRAMEADGLTLQQFNESAGGQVVFHLHFHVLPRWDGVALKPPGIMGDRAAIEAQAARIRAAL
jgi:histidine triad (HIT) family protein